MVGGYADLMQQFGLIDSMQAVYVKKQTDAAIVEISAGNYTAAFQVCWYKLENICVFCNYMHTISRNVNFIYGNTYTTFENNL